MRVAIPAKFHQIKVKKKEDNKGKAHCHDQSRHCHDPSRHCHDPSRHCHDPSRHYHDLFRHCHDCEGGNGDGSIRKGREGTLLNALCFFPLFLVNTSLCELRSSYSSALRVFRAETRLAVYRAL